ncbi:MAG: flippase-like domain-containing protein [Prevotellaceae bacterium]|nr:flippase-like domain-containing protein [Prevotellaceae bacterium]
MNKKLSTGLKFAAFLLLTALLLWFSFRKADMAQLWQGVKSAHYGWVILTVIIGVFAYFIRAQRWRLLINPLGYKPSLGAVYNAVVIGYFANLLFPRLGEVARCGTLNKSDKIPFDKLVGTVVVERVFDLICLIVVVLATFFLRIESFGKFLRENLLQKIAGENYFSLIVAVVAALVAFAVVLFSLWYFRKKLIRHSPVKKAWSFVKGIGDGLKSFAAMRHRGQFLLHSVLLWGSYWLMAWLALYAIPATAQLGPVDGLVVMVLGSFGIIAPTNGGLGAYHAITSIGMFAIFGIPENDGLLYATISHESQMLFMIILGLVAYVQLFFAKKKLQ